MENVSHPVTISKELAMMIYKPTKIFKSEARKAKLKAYKEAMPPWAKFAVKGVAMVAKVAIKLTTGVKV